MMEIYLISGMFFGAGAVFGAVALCIWWASRHD
jgi:hypothetical protein